MSTPHERAAQLWMKLTTLLPIEQGDYDYQGLTESCQLLIAEALAPPIDKSDAWERLIGELVIAGVMETAPVIEALYVYREALLKWQREIIDGHACEAELAIRTLRGYTRSQGPT